MLTRNGVWLLMLALFSSSCFAIDSGYKGLLLEPVKSINRQTLINHEGQQTHFPAADGRLQLVFFGYTNCPDVCPMTMHKVKNIIATLGDDAKHIKFTFLSIDGVRDDVGKIKNYIKGFHTSINGLVGSPHAMKAVEKEFGVLTRKFQGKSALAYTMEHSVYMYLLDGEGRLRLMYPASISSEAIVTDIRKLFVLENSTAQTRIDY
jgi:protein SCO1/2